MASHSLHSPYLLVLATTISVVVHSAITHPDVHPLMSFKAASDPSNKLATWNSATSNPCAWSGISCLRDRVTRLVLEDLDLAGSIRPLTALTQLRVLSLKRNRFRGPIPSLANLTALNLLFLSHNHFSGEFPAALASLSRLHRLDLSHNNLSGEIPAAVNRLTRLLTLRVDSNQIRGRIPGINLSRLQDFNVSSNRLSGQIPESLSGFPGSAFSHNPSLCGAPLRECKASPALASKPRNDAVCVNETRAPRTGVMVSIVVGDVLVLALVSLLLLYCNSRRSRSALPLSSKAEACKGCVEKGGMVFWKG
ncbi:Leucine-rich repeat receptor protein kinase [Spatholobus suberectus]|nr:Leucine-rich repeat receptor protein kinase [Spatholobus suberectus]